MDLTRKRLERAKSARPTNPQPLRRECLFCAYAKAHYTQQSMTKNKLTSAELVPLLQEHAEWLSDSGKGRRLELTDRNLDFDELPAANFRKAAFRRCSLISAELTGADFTDSEIYNCVFNKAICRRTLFKQAVLSESTFIDADCTEASFEDSTRLLPGAFRGALLEGISLPATVVFSAKDRISELSKQISALTLTLLGACAYCFLTVASTKDSGLIIDSSATNLPIIQTPVPLGYFYPGAAFLVLCIFLFLQLTTQLLWEKMLQMPLVLPDGTRRSELMIEWLSMPFLDQGHDNTAKLRKAIVAICVWMTVPATMLVLWWRYLPRHSELISIFQGVLTVASFFLAGGSFFKGKRSFGAGVMNAQPKAWRAYLLLVLGLILAVVVPRIAFSFITADLRNADLSKAHLEKVDLRKARMEGADLTEASLDGADLRGVTLDHRTKISDKWRRVACLLRDIPTTNNDEDCERLAGLAWADLSGAKLAGLDLRGATLVGANLNGANLLSTNLDEADLRLADLTHAVRPKSSFKAHSEGALGVEGDSRFSSGPLVAPLGLLNRQSQACITLPRLPKNLKPPSHLMQCAPKIKEQRTWLFERFTNGSFAISGPPQHAMCLDASGFGNGAPIEMYDCNETNQTQQWHIEPRTTNFVELRKNASTLCVNGTALRSSEGNAVLQECDAINHEQEWQIILPDLPPPTHLGWVVNHINVRRRQDADLAAREYQLSPKDTEHEGLDYRRQSVSGRKVESLTNFSGR